MNFVKSAPFVFFILIGVVAGKRFRLDKESFSKLLLFFVSPLVFFETTWGSGIGFLNLGMPLLFALVASFLAISAYKLSPRFLRLGSPDSNLLAFAMGSSNSGYFGLPVAVALYGESFLPQMALVVMGFTLYEYTTGFYITARSHFSVRASLKKLTKLPALYAYVFALLLNECGVEKFEVAGSIASYMRGAYSFLGLVVLGLGLSDMTVKNLDVRFLLKAFATRFVAWPIVAVGVIYFLGASPESHLFKAFSLVAFLPMAANGVVIATELKTSPHKIAGAIAISTLVSLVALNLKFHLHLVEWAYQLSW